MGVCMLIGGGAICLCHCIDTMCNWVLMCEGPKDILSMVTHVLCISRFYHLSDLCVCHIFIFPEVVGYLFIYLFGCLIATYLCKGIWFWPFMFHNFCDFLLQMCGD